MPGGVYDDGGSSVSSGAAFCANRYSATRMINGAYPPRIPNGAKSAPRLRSRTSVLLLTVLLLTSVAIATLTIKLLDNQCLVLEDAIREARALAMSLLANRVEQTLLASVRTPFFAVKNVPPAEVGDALISHLREQFPEVERVLFLDAKMRVRRGFPPPRTCTRARARQLAGASRESRGSRHQHGRLRPAYFRRNDRAPAEAIRRGTRQ